MATLLLTHPSFTAHDTGPGHPERADRMRAIDKVLAHEIFNGLVREEAPLRDDVEAQIRLAHPEAHLEKMRAVGERARERRHSTHIDGDTVVSPGTWEAALRAVGAGLAAIDAVIAGKATNAFCQVRPPGHHAEADRAMGFCLFSNAAIAGLYARAKHGAERIAIVDFDVHHGNGTQDIFWSDKDLFYGSTHEMPLFPGTGAVSERGVGNINNAPLRAGDAGERFREAFESRILPALHDFGPDILIISAGFDAHQADPLANLRLVEADYLWATEKLADMAKRHCNGRIVSMLEGGYDLNALARSVAVHVKALMDAGA
ncbi:MAG: histone deacetylase family protein [Hyphomicrobium sp.]|uniref:histone deacetylase family protein n=1 Tax=Hyphomicrobium sp. TaxID=82 RepID=UPI001327B813|nr:histone deacetylase family protein [Hyphomicrobium sp.]KAB2940101.1 MAG: histone deacetylase family protein [Hyphomicrobium sp.]MBZ0208629.1 histone deacetylase family protein [Hyphomicrobium sp.]